MTALSHTPTLLALALLAACNLRPYTLDSAAGDTTSTTTSSATPDTTAETTLAPATATAATTTGGPGPGVWRGLYRRDYLEWVWLDDDLFLDCATQQVWQLRSDALPKVCGAIDGGAGLYLQIAGILHPDGDDEDALDELEVTEFLADPCALGSCDEPLDWSSCGPWEDVCGYYLGCDVWTQDCPEGQKCVPFSADGDQSHDSLKCVPVAPGAGEAGDPCTAENGGVDGFDTCAKGHVCWNLDEDAKGTCVPQCTGSPAMPMCPACTSCNISQLGVMTFCLPGCGPLLQDCLDYEACIASLWNPDNFICVLDASGDEGQLFDPCEYAIEIPEYCAAAFGPGLYLGVAGVLHPDGADSDPVDEIEVTEFLADPCRMADFHGTIDWTACAPWPDVCDYPRCDVWAQDCPEGQKCMPYSGDGDNAWESLKCVPVAPGAGGPGDPCTADGGSVSGHDTCAKGHMCWDLDIDTAVGTCVPQCTGAPDAPQCPEGTTCTIAAGGELALCHPTCSPLAQDCEPTEVCLPNPVLLGDFRCVLDASGMEGQVFDPCEYDNACDPGLVCVGPELASECDPQALGCCLPFCDLTQPSCPGVGQQCLAWYEQGMAPPGNENIGLCGLPP